jgi:hypothetical protein
LSLLSLLWLLPLSARNLAAATHILLAPFAILALPVTIWRRASDENRRLARRISAAIVRRTFRPFPGWP